MADSWIERLQQKVWYWMDHAADTRELSPEERRAWQQEHNYETTYPAAKVIAGICSAPTISQVRDLFVHAAEVTKKARTILKIGNALGLATAFRDAEKAIDKVFGVTGDFNAACEISEAIAVLDTWLAPTTQVANIDAAKAFDKLLGAAGRYMKKLPPPANQFAAIFEEIRKDNFFSGMTQLLDPENPNTAQGRALRDAMRSD